MSSLSRLIHYRASDLATSPSTQALIDCGWKHTSGIKLRQQSGG